MTFLLNGLKLLVATAIVGKLVCVQHVFSMYDGVMQHVSENSHEAFSLLASGAIFIY